MYDEEGKDKAYENIAKVMESLQTKTLAQDEVIESLSRDPPESFYCGFEVHFYHDSVPATIPYGSLVYERSNQPTGGLDISTGVFSSPYPGTYLVTWSLHAFNSHGESVSVYLRKNGAQINESVHISSFELSEVGHVKDQGGRTMFVHLDLGETLDL